MSVSRNKPCPCGSGKKYKKCCMAKNNVIDLHRLKEDRFYEQKHVVVTMVTEFVWGQMNRRDLEQLEAIFDKRTKNYVNEDAKPLMFHFYSLFMHQYENGLRGIEWFYKEKSSQLEPNLKTMAMTWASLPFCLVHAIEYTEDTILFEDVITKKTYPAARLNENVPSQIGPYYGTVGLLELHQDKYYFNGVRVFMSPIHVSQAKMKVESLMKETGWSYKKVMMEYSAEVFAALLEDQNSQIQEEDIHTLEELGLEHLPAYAEDFLAFYKEKTAGKKENTVRKYRESLHDINEVLKRNQMFSLHELDENSWIKLLSKEYFDMYETMTKTQITDLISTLKAFVQWMKRKKKTDLWPGLAHFLKEEEKQFIHAVQLPNSFFPNYFRGFNGQMNEVAKLLKGEILLDSETVEGLFEIKKANKQSFRVTLLASLQKGTKAKKRAEYTINGAELQMEYVEEGLIFSGKISTGRTNMWELVKMEDTFPRTAKPFIL
ncbi:SEC-C domain-containing protein [Alkalihalobacillus sp. BA299]|uniref:SEC-C domain-containing protein n=1 Tax=Alkalihalobacillus sp. BA299 TaxID=2815938 RepID=UPI001ADBC658|nr:SEC-C domain-containing protein [Alkalihalobacillus sp. BA299]